MQKRKLIALAIALGAGITAQARDFAAGFGVGAFTGLATGLISSKIAQANTPPAVYYVEDPYARYERERLEIERRNLIEQRRLERAHYSQPKIIKIQKTSVVKNHNKERELALREKELELQMIREKKELLKEENRKKELALKEKEVCYRLALN